MKIAKKKIRRSILLACLLGLLVFMEQPIPVYADDVEVAFGSNWYEKKNQEQFPVGLYIRTEQGTGDYKVTLRYNPLRLEYVSGADEADTENGILTLQGTNGGTEIKYWLQFRALSGGETELQVETVEVFVPGSDEVYEITGLARVPVRVDGEDTALAEEERLAEEQLAEEQLAEEGQTEEGQPEEPANEASGIQTGNSSGDETINGTGEATKRHHSIFFNVFFFAVMVGIVLVVLIDIVVWNLIKRARAKRERQEAEAGEDGMEILNLDHFEAQLGKEITSIMDDAVKEQTLGEPVIKVCDVTMEFHLSSVNPSGLKEYLIQMLKREVSYRKLYALYHVSFNVFKGEVVGIIGTNGSGKSTLLKIISGALKPTEGHVEVDCGKIQILTLGTGFDMELTARENVFLNGAIIGYSKEFLERHYYEIVEFAELEDFMEEKVKNFSSGMVSRLGFAIATAGDAAEILILDEVLSVGDEFFRKKSLKRIKEMIHGGSTVLMVSHGMGTILENCTKCVWIEKGELRMIGEPGVVCEAYRDSIC